MRYTYFSSSIHRAVSRPYTCFSSPHVNQHLHTTHHVFFSPTNQYPPRKPHELFPYLNFSASSRLCSSNSLAHSISSAGECLITRTTPQRISVFRERHRFQLITYRLFHFLGWPEKWWNRSHVKATRRRRCWRSKAMLTGRGVWTSTAFRCRLNAQRRNLHVASMTAWEF